LKIFVETSVFIASHTQSPKQAKKVEACLGEGTGHTKVSSLVVRQEIKRRLLGDAAYLHSLLVKYNNYEETNYHLIRLSGNPYHGNRARICQGLLLSVQTGTDSDKVDRLKARLRRFILTTLATFDSWLDQLERSSGCVCSQIDPREVHKNNKMSFDLGAAKCDQVQSCPIGDFLTQSAESCKLISDHLSTELETNPRQQLADILTFLAKTNSSGFSATQENPCYTVADLLLTLEAIASKCDSIYSMNYKDFRVLCKAVDLTFRHLSHDPEVPDTTQ
jgi:hypothetical protein